MANITWASTPSISQVQLPSGNLYLLKDAEARIKIDDIAQSISSGVHFVGRTTTQISDGDTSNVITINGKSYTAQPGDLVVYEDKEFVWGGDKWLEFGDLGSLGALAFKDSATGSYQPAGTITTPTFTGTSATISLSGQLVDPTVKITTVSTGIVKLLTSVTVDSQLTLNGTSATINVPITASGTVSITTTATNTGFNYQPSGTITQPTFTGTTTSIATQVTPAGSVAISIGNGATNYQPTGSVGAPTFTGTTATINVPVTASGTVSVTATANNAGNYQPAGSISKPGVTVTPNTTNISGITGVGTLPSFSTTVSNEVLTFSWNSGTLPSMASSISVMTGATASLDAAPTFTGTTASITATFSGTQVTGSTSYQPAGSNTAPAFTGTSVELKAAFTGTTTTYYASYQPSGIVAQPTFSGEKTLISAVFTGTQVTGSTDYTPHGKVPISLSSDGVYLEGSVADYEVKVSGNYTPSGTISAPTFTGTTATITVS